jgi:hypothetical protein
MQYVMLSDRFGGLNTYLNPDKVGPTGAQEMFGADVSTGALTNSFTSQFASPDPSFLPKTLLTFKGVTKLYAERYATAQYGGVLYRSHRGWEWYQAGLPNGIQYSTNGNTWDILTIPQPPSAAGAATVTGSGGSIAIGTYEYVFTFKNALGYESAPSGPATAAVTANNSKVTLNLPPRVTTGATTINQTAVLSVADIGKIRVGMRLAASGGIPANAYVTEVNNITNAFLMSLPATSTATSNIIDAQITTINIYRKGGGITEYLFVDSRPMGTATYEDTKANTSLGSLLTTQGCDQLPPNVKNLTINPSGTLMCVDSSENILFFSLSNVANANPGLYRPEQSIKSPDIVMASIYALDRFTFFTDNRNFSIFLDNALDGLPALKFIEDSEPCRLSNFVYPVEYNSRIFWNTSNGIMTTDGSSISLFTRYTFKKEENQAFINCYGSVSYNDAVYFYLPDPLTGTATSSIRWIYKFTEEHGWSKVFGIPIPAAGADGSIGFFDQEGVACGYGPDSTIPGDTANKLRYAENSRLRGNNGVYWTGEWTGDKHSALKKFRKISALFSGPIEIEIYIDGVALPNKVSADNGTATKRISWWLPAATKGRAISLKVTLGLTTTAVVEELGIWVGEQRREMP